VNRTKRGVRMSDAASALRAVAEVLSGLLLFGQTRCSAQLCHA
jgi:hypothetical protein